MPCFRSRQHILPVLDRVPDYVDRIIAVDDACPEATGEFVVAGCVDTRVEVIRHQSNQGVGGAMISGYRAALSAGADIVVKVDSDGQMDPLLIEVLITPIVERRADYTKGNRFFELGSLSRMPWIRLWGNAALSLVNKFTSGYWDVMDPTNGFTAIHAKVLKRLPLDKLDRRYFFESDMLFRLGTLRATVIDVPMDAVYADETSNLRISRVFFEFPGKYLSRFLKRVFYSYFLRDFNAGSLQMLLGATFFCFGAIFGAWHWLQSALTVVAATSGTVMIAAVPVLLGGHLLLGALQYDISSVPRITLHPLFPA